MELRRYWQILKRRWLLIVIPVAVVVILTAVTYQRPPTFYNVGMHYLVSQEPSSEAADADEQRYYNWLTSEYIVNGLTDWVKGGEFATAVSAELAAEGWEIPAGAIQGGLAADNVRSKLEISLNNPDPEALAAMISAVTVVLQEQNSDALPQLGGETAVIVPLSEPVINPISPGIRSQLDLPVRILVALIAGVGLALLVEYLDPTIRESRELKAIGLEILGEIPKK
jgi:capsular polysaccharide biosynthesis protein